MKLNNQTALIMALVTIFTMSFLDSSPASFWASILVLLSGLLLCKSIDSTKRRGAYKTLFIVTSVYISSAYIFSLSFDQYTSYVVSDSMRYLQYYQNSTEYVRGWGYLYDTYIRFTDNNGLYNTYIQMWAAIGNRHLGGATVFYMTLAQTLFGVLCSVILYRVVVRFYPEKAVKYTITFSCCSLFLFYSSVIIRDITVALFFIYALDYLTQEFKFQRLIILIVFGFIVWGVRLYSGLFYFIFPICYIALRMTKHAGKSGTIMLLLSLGLIMLPVVAVTALGEQTQAEIEEYEEFSAERNENGLFYKLSNLPVGVKQIALTLFSQISPFPPHGFLQSASTLSQAIMGLDLVIYEFFWFFIVYMLAYLCLIRGKYKDLTRTELILVMIALLYIVANTAHPDIRRMMPVYPIIYLVNLNVMDRCSTAEVATARKRLRLLYVALIAFALIYRG